jgi:hypothetical protein
MVKGPLTDQTTLKDSAQLGYIDGMVKKPLPGRLIFRSQIPTTRHYYRQNQAIDLNFRQ